MSQAISIRETPPQTVLSNDQLQYIAKTEFVPTGLRGNLPAILACVATGRALGIDDMTAIRSIHIIEGKATFSAELMVMLVRRRGHSITGEVGEGTATVVGKRADTGDTMTSTWTLKMAERAGLAKKGNWVKYPESMLWARAVSQLCRMLFADCFAGATYTTEELGAEDTDSFGAPVDDDDGLFPPVDQPVPGLHSPEGVEIASPSQQRLILAKASEAGLDDDARHALIERVTGQPSTKAVPKALVNAVLEALGESDAGVVRAPDHEGTPSPDPDAEGVGASGSPSASSEAETLRRTLRTIAESAGVLADVDKRITNNAAEHGVDSATHIAWLKTQIARAEAVV